MIEELSKPRKYYVTYGNRRLFYVVMALSAMEAAAKALKWFDRYEGPEDFTTKMDMGDEVWIDERGFRNRHETMIVYPLDMVLNYMKGI